MTKITVTENKILMQQARESLKGKWGLAVWTSFVYMVITVIAQNVPKAGFLISIFTSPIYLGWCIFTLAVSRNRDPRFSQLFDGFKRYWTAVGAYVLCMIFIILWAILLIIPGIIAALSYAMTLYIIADNDSIGPLKAIKNSKEMMRGYKWKLFCLGLRFLGWLLLCILTLGIGFLWFGPYVGVSMAKFYDDLLTPMNSGEKEGDTSFSFE